MKEDLGTQLKPTELEELQLIGAMVARGESADTIESRWKKLVTEINTVKPIKDIQELTQYVLKEAYQETSKDLEFYAAKVKYYDTMKKQVRDEIAQVRKLNQDYMNCLEQNLSSLEDYSQLTILNLQTAQQKQQQTIQMFSNVLKMMNDTAMAIIRNIRG